MPIPRKTVLGMYHHFLSPPLSPYTRGEMVVMMVVVQGHTLFLLGLLAPSGSGDDLIDLLTLSPLPLVEERNRSRLVEVQNLRHHSGWKRMRGWSLGVL